MKATHTPGRGLRAFTLIELLIVVAIIAILAAIAVPNFLEAQVRSKVSRALADMRTIATGLESYRVDNNKYPQSIVDTPLAPAYNVANLQHCVVAKLTTPIAYLTSFPQDAFQGDYRTTLPGADPLRLRRLYDYRKVRLGPTTGGTTLFESATGLGTGVGEEFPSWLLYSPGPDREQNINTGLALSATVPVGGFGDPLSTWPFYDPTNGTVSVGDIVRTPEGEAAGLISR